MLFDLFVCQECGILMASASLPSIELRKLFGLVTNEYLLVLNFSTVKGGDSLFYVIIVAYVVYCNFIRTALMQACCGQFILLKQARSLRCVMLSYSTD